MTKQQKNMIRQYHRLLRKHESALHMYQKHEGEMVHWRHTANDIKDKLIELEKRAEKIFSD